jgi:hypothetical protein
LLTGGFNDGEIALATAELFDPETGRFTPTNPMSTARQSHTATRLPDGKILIAGGYNGDYLASAELYDPQSGQFTPAGSLTTRRSGHVAVLLDSGEVLLAGGVGEGWTFLASAERYDPVAGTFTPVGGMLTPRESHTATLLKNGKVLITGGHQGRRAAITIYASAELFDPLSGTFSPTGEMTIRRHKHDATLLADGTVFISGGSDERDDKGAYRQTERYDPLTETFTSAGEMHRARYKHAGTSLLLQNGDVLLIGGASVSEIFDPESGTFRALADSVATTRLFATATLLANGDVLFAGGYGSNIVAGTQAWVIDPSAEDAPER